MHFFSFPVLTQIGNVLVRYSRKNKQITKKQKKAINEGDWMEHTYILFTLLNKW